MSRNVSEWPISNSTNHNWTRNSGIYWSYQSYQYLLILVSISIGLVKVQIGQSLRNVMLFHVLSSFAIHLGCCQDFFFTGRLPKERLMMMDFTRRLMDEEEQQLWHSKGSIEAVEVAASPPKSWSTYYNVCRREIQLPCLLRLFIFWKSIMTVKAI